MQLTFPLFIQFLSWTSSWSVTTRWFLLFSKTFGAMITWKNKCFIIDLINDVTINNAEGNNLCKKLHSVWQYWHYFHGLPKKPVAVEDIFSIFSFKLYLLNMKSNLVGCYPNLLLRLITQIKPDCDQIIWRKRQI